MRKDFWKQVMGGSPKFRKDIIERALGLSEPYNVKSRNPRRKWPSNKQADPTFEKGKRYFLDVGAWQGDRHGYAHTDFGIVSGNYVLLCSWLNMEKRGLSFTKYCKDRKSVV